MDAGQDKAIVEVAVEVLPPAAMLDIGKAFTAVLAAAEKHTGRRLVMEAYVMVHDDEHVGLGIEFYDRLGVMPAEGRA